MPSGTDGVSLVSDADDLEIKKRARRRLVGAAALALLAAVVLPVMMDQEPSPAVQDIQVTIPDRDAVPALPRPSTPAEAPAPALPPVPEEEAPRSAPPPASPQAVEPAQPAPEAAEARKPDAKPAPKAELKPEPKAAAAAEARAPAGDDAEAARVRAILGGKEVPARAEVFVLQVGAFGDAAKAAQIAAELKKQGFAAYTEKAGSVTRVRVGPVADRDAGEKLAARLQAAGHDAVLTAR